MPVTLWLLCPSILAMIASDVPLMAMTGDLMFEQVGPDGEIKHGTLGEATYTNKADTYAKMLAITRTDIINDDLGALTAAPYMSNAKYTGNCAFAWYLLADPADLPVLEIVALNGRVELVIETADADFNVLGVQMRGYSDVGVEKQEYRTGVRADESAAD